MSKNTTRTKKHASQNLHFGVLDWLCVLFGLSVSIVTPLIDHVHSQIYIVISIVVLICGVFEMVLGIKGRRSNYIFALINTFASIFVAWNDQFYGNMAINAYYIIIFVSSIYGYYNWHKFIGTSKTEGKAKR